MIKEPIYFKVDYGDEHIGVLKVSGDNPDEMLISKLRTACMEHFGEDDIQFEKIYGICDRIITTDMERLNVKVDGFEYKITISRTWLY